jgi:hypothetical protein
MTTQTLIQLGEPVEHRGIVLAPLFPRTHPRAQYVTLDGALGLGFEVTEVGAGGSVPEVLAATPTDSAVIVCDGEELVGAKQNRILNVTVLVPARGTVRLLVSCIEQGRWSRGSGAFSAAGHTAYPELRRRKAERLAAAPLRLGAAQEEVWSAVAEKSIRLGSYSPTGAQAHIFASRGRELADLRGAFALEPGQSGALLALGSDLLCLDYLSRPEAFARLYPKLLDGYLLDALERLDGEPAKAGRLEAFVDTVLAAPRRREPSVGLGEDVRVSAKGLVGSGLELDGELLQLSAYSTI